MSKTTPFKSVDSSKKLPEVEEEVLKFWEENKIFEKSVENRKTDDDSNLYSFYDGPPFATGLPHYGHIVGSLMKDVIPRYWAMKGKYIPRKWGWDCHGLPIENIVEKEMGSRTKKEIEELGVDKFNELCRSKVLEYAGEWEKIIPRLGRWADMKNAYRTMDKDFMESVWWTFKQLWDKDLIYYNYRSMHICPRCETTLSQSEVSEGYKDVKDLSVIAKFELEKLPTSNMSSPRKAEGDVGSSDDTKTYILAWTTTPWTLPGNVALAVGKDIDYVEIEKKDESVGELVRFVLAKNKLKELFGPAKNKKVFLISGKHAFASRTYFPQLKKDLEKAGYTVTIIDHVNPTSPNLEENLKAFKKYDFKNAHVITHSLGANTILTLLTNTDTNLLSLTMIAPPYPGKTLVSTDKNWEKEAGYSSIILNTEKIKQQITHTPVILYSNDSLIPEEDFKALGKDLSAKLVKEKNKAHYFEPEVNNFPDFDIISNLQNYTNYKVIDEFKGKDLIGLKYRPLWDVYADDEKLENRENGWRVYDADFVTTEEGTGVVHIAPAFGEDDMNLGKEKNLPFVQHVAMNGVVDNKVEAIGGLNVKPINNPQSTDVEVIKYLAGKGLLFDKEKYEHSYPHCWRCDTPLINYATGSWFVAVTKIKEQLLENAKGINWTPKHIKEGRFGNWLEGARDWSISRQRFWASVMPIWVCDKCREKKVFGSTQEVEDKLGSFFMMRHGEAEHNVKKILSGRINDGYLLTNKGIESAKNAGKQLKGKKIDLIISSDLDRAKQTSELVAKEIDVKIIFDERLRDVDMGDYNDKKQEDIKDFLNDWVKAKKNIKFPNGDSWESLFDRVRNFYNHLLTKYYNKNVLIVSHGDTLITLKALLTGKNMIDGLRQVRKEPYPEKATPIKTNYKLIDLHKHIVDKITFKCTGCDGEMKRVPDVLDTWFDSGSMPYGQAHYPFDNKESFEKSFPADFIAEGIDQTRAWFYYLHVIAGGIFDKKAFKNVIVNGIVLAEDGQKMSKKLKNYPDPMDMVHKYGADPLRFYLMQSPVVNANDLNFSEKDLAEIARGTFRMLWQSYSFFVMYANIDKFTVHSSQFTESKNILDRWLVSELHQLIKEVNERMENYELMQATRLFAPFVDNLSNWYIRRSRKRFWKSENDEDKNNAYTTLHYVLVELSKTIAPFAPFIAEEIYRNLVRSSNLVRNNEQNDTTSETMKQGASRSHEQSATTSKALQRAKRSNKASADLQADLSVHLADYPVADEKLIDDELNKKMNLIREIISEGLKLRARTQVKVRQPLQGLTINNEKLKITDEFIDIIKEELNVKEVFWKEFNFDKNAKNMSEVSGIKILLDTEITPELKMEGQAREIIRAIQQMRKEANYQLDDRIEVGYQGLNKVFDKFGDLVKHETLANSLSPEKLKEVDLEKEIKIDETVVKLQIKK